MGIIGMVGVCLVVAIFSALLGGRIGTNGAILTAKIEAGEPVDLAVATRYLPLYAVPMPASTVAEEMARPTKLDRRNTIDV